MKTRSTLFILISSFSCGFASDQVQTTNKSRLHELLIAPDEVLDLTVSQAQDLVVLFQMSRELKLMMMRQNAYDAASSPIIVTVPNGTSTARRARLQNEQEIRLQAYLQKFDPDQTNRLRATVDVETRSKAAIVKGMATAAPVLASVREYELLKEHPEKARPALLAAAKNSRSPYRLSSYLAIRRIFPALKVDPVPKQDLVACASNRRNGQSRLALHALALDGHFDELNALIASSLDVPTQQAEKPDAGQIEYLQDKIREETKNIDRSGEARDYISRGEKFGSLAVADSSSDSFKNAIADFEHAAKILESPAAKRGEFYPLTKCDVYQQRALAEIRWAQHVDDEVERDRLRDDAEKYLRLAISAADATSNQDWVNQQLRLRKTSALSMRARLMATRGRHDRAIADWDAAAALRPGQQADYELRGDSYLKVGKPAEAMKDFRAMFDHEKRGFTDYYKRDAVYRMIHFTKTIRLLGKIHLAAISSQDLAAVGWSQDRMDEELDLLP